MLKVFEAFAGYGSQSLALERLGIPHEVVAISEIDKYAIQGYYSLHDKSIPNLGDISKIKVEDIPDHDLFTYSFPCQDISVAGRIRGIVAGETRSGLLYECEKIIEGKKPKYLLMENVKNLVSKKFKADFDRWLDYLEGLGYTNYWKVLNAKHYGVPQNRERVFVVSILGEHEPYKFPEPVPLTTRVRDLLDDGVAEKYYLKDEIQERFLPFPKDRLKGEDLEVLGTTAPNPYDKDGNIIYNKCTSAWVYNTDKLMSTLSARDYKQPKQIIELPCVGASRGRNPKNPSSRAAGEHTEQRLEINSGGTSNALTTVLKDNYVVEKTFRIRKLTPKECFRLMGLTDNDIEKIQATGVSDTQQYKMAGNSIVIDVLEAIFKNLF